MRIVTEIDTLTSDGRAAQTDPGPPPICRWYTGRDMSLAQEIRETTTNVGFGEAF
jgi:hypothetical protein